MNGLKGVPTDVLQQTEIAARNELETRTGDAYITALFVEACVVKELKSRGQHWTLDKLYS